VDNGGAAPINISPAEPRQATSQSQAPDPSVQGTQARSSQTDSSRASDRKWRSRRPSSNRSGIAVLGAHTDRHGFRWRRQRNWRIRPLEQPARRERPCRRDAIRPVEQLEFRYFR
jgi:hypothetical protein